MIGFRDNRDPSETCRSCRYWTPSTTVYYATCHNTKAGLGGAIFPIARAATEKPVSERTQRDMNRLYESAQAGNKVPLDVRLKGGSFEPGISKDERIDRMAATTTDAAMKFVAALSPTPPMKAEEKAK